MERLLTRSDEVGATPSFDSIAWAFEVHVGEKDEGKYQTALLRGPSEDAPDRIEFWESSSPLVGQRPDFMWVAPLDVWVQNEGSIFLFHPRSEAAREWMKEHCPQDGEHQYLGEALVVEHRYAVGLAQRAREDGLRVG